ncbi:acireductone dioxygenase [Salinispirillum marinum]|uniref:Acireductone dioxygenase n=2 Tax=Saccharospirillaceae TaxID=255527 RepID=A0ABV8BJC6_9GAMM
MSRLTVYADQDPSSTVLDTTDAAQIAATLAKVGVRFERWDAPHDLPKGASNDEILALYKKDIDRLIAQDGYQTVDVVHMVPDHPEKAAFRQKFLDEHRHSEDEVRFFVQGQGLFCLHLQDQVFQVLCTRNDLISVPANTPHWFDMGTQPEFTAIRLFNNPEGWVAHFTGSDIGQRFPYLDAIQPKANQ